jgi:ZIP family zinc transporter
MLLAFRNAIGRKWTGLIMAFGAGTLISAVAYQLVLSPIIEEQFFLLGLGLAAGSLTFYIGDRWVDHLGGANRKDFDGAQASGSGTAILLGTLLDNIPESIVLGLTLARSGQVSLAFLAAVCVSNLPEGLGGTTGMLSAGWPRRRIARLWLWVFAASVLACVLGYGLARLLLAATGAFAEAFAAGALLTMLADAMIPEAFQHGGTEAGLFQVLGFAVGLVLVLAQLMS